MVKFLLLENGTFIAGKVEFHSDLWTQFCLSSRNDNNSKPSLSGAGAFFHNHPGVISWTSLGFSFITPHEKRGEILEFIKKIRTEFN